MTDILPCDIVLQTNPWCSRPENELGRCDNCSLAEKVLRERILRFGKKGKISKIDNQTVGEIKVKYEYKTSTPEDGIVFVEALKKGVFSSEKFTPT